MRRFLLAALLCMACGIPYQIYAADGPLPLPQRTKELNQRLREAQNGPAPTFPIHRSPQSDERFTNHAAGHAYAAQSKRIRGPGAIIAALAVGIAAVATDHPFWFCVFAAVAVGIAVTVVIRWLNPKPAASELVSAPAVSTPPCDHQQAPPQMRRAYNPPKVYGWKHLLMGLGILVAIFFIGVLINAVSS